VLLRLVGRMDRREFSNTVISLTGPGDLAPKFEEAGIPIVHLSMGGAAGSVFGVFKLLRSLREIKPDVVQGWLYHGDLFALIGGKLTGVRNIAWNIRNADMGEDYYRGFHGLLVRLLATLSKIPECVIVNSHAGRSLHISRGYHPTFWCHIPNGFDLVQFHPNESARKRIRLELGIAESDCLIGIVARFDSIKGHSDFFAAADRLLETNSDVKFVAVGQGLEPGGQVIESMKLSKKLSEHLLPVGARDDVADILAAMDILVSASLGEGFSNVIGEAMACGLPCVVTDVGDSAQIVGAAGRIIPPANPKMLAEALKELVSMPRRSLRELGGIGRASIEKNYSADGAVHQYQDLYRALALGNNPE